MYNPKFTGTITFGGDLIQSHDSSIEDDKISAIPLCLAMKHCMEQDQNRQMLIQVENLKNKLSEWKKESSSAKIDSGGMIEKNLNEISKILNGETVNLKFKETRASKLEELIRELIGTNSKGAAGTDKKLNVKHGDELVNLISNLKENYEKIKINIEQKINDGEKINPSIIYVAGNHELEALNEGQHPEVRTIMQDMFKEGLVEYCHYDEASDTLISHTKLNKPLVLKILRDYKEENPNDSGKISELNELMETIGNDKGIIGHEEKQKNMRKNLAKILNENFAKTSKNIEIGDTALFDPGPEGISDFAIVGEELERTYFRGEKQYADAKKDFEKEYKKKNKDENGLTKLEVLKIAALVLSKNKDKLVTSDKKKSIILQI